MEESRNKTYVADIERGVYDIKDEMHHKFTTGKGLTEEIVRKISKKKNEGKMEVNFSICGINIFSLFFPGAAPLSPRYKIITLKSGTKNLT